MSIEENKETVENKIDELVLPEIDLSDGPTEVNVNEDGTLNIPDDLKNDEEYISMLLEETKMVYSMLDCGTQYNNIRYGNKDWMKERPVDKDGNLIRNAINIRLESTPIIKLIECNKLDMDVVKVTLSRIWIEVIGSLIRSTYIHELQENGTAMTIKELINIHVELITPNKAREALSEPINNVINDIENSEDITKESVVMDALVGLVCEGTLDTNVNMSNTLFMVHLLERLELMSYAEFYKITMVILTEDLLLVNNEGIELLSNDYLLKVSEEIDDVVDINNIYDALVMLHSELDEMDDEEPIDEEEEEEEEVDTTDETPVDEDVAISEK